MSIVCHYFKSTLQIYKIVMNNEPNARKNLLVRGYENTRENFADFFIEVGQLLWSGFSGEFVGAYRSTRPSGSKDASVWATTRVNFPNFSAELSQLLCRSLSNSLCD